MQTVPIQLTKTRAVSVYCCCIYTGTPEQQKDVSTLLYKNIEVSGICKLDTPNTLVTLSTRRRRK
jgi:hypothetical protein